MSAPNSHASDAEDALDDMPDLVPHVHRGALHSHSLTVVFANVTPHETESSLAAPLDLALDDDLPALVQHEAVGSAACADSFQSSTANAAPDHGIDLFAAASATIDAAIENSLSPAAPACRLEYSAGCSSIGGLLERMFLSVCLQNHVCISCVVELSVSTEWFRFALVPPAQLFELG